MAVNVGGLVGMIVFYALILVVGIVTTRKKKGTVEETLLAGRGLGLLICTLTLTGEAINCSNNTTRSNQGLRGECCGAL